jgi:hypothetical protein
MSATPGTSIRLNRPSVVNSGPLPDTVLRFIEFIVLVLFSHSYDYGVMFRQKTHIAIARRAN